MTQPAKRPPGWIKKRVRINRRALTIANCTKNLAKQLGRDPSDAEVAQMLAMSVAKLVKLRGA